MKKFYVFKVILLILTSFVFAESEYQADYQEKKCLACSVDDSDLFRKNEEVVFVNGEFLYWTADSPDLEYAFQTDQTIAQINYGLGDYKFANYDYKPGFRLALGWFNAPSFWQTYLQFTWMRITGSNSANRSEPFDQPLVGAFPQNVILGQELASASSSIKLNHELGDLIIARVFCPNPHLRLRLFGGFTGGRIKQSWNVTYTDVTNQEERIFNQFRFLGAGLRLGVDFDWFWSCNFYLTAKVSTAPLLGKYKNIGTINADTGGFPYQDVKYDQTRGAYNVQAYIGPSYQYNLDCSRIEFFAGYELNSWFNVLEIVRPSEVLFNQRLITEHIAHINSGMFLLHGLSARFTWDF